jgi:hypothetical protein
MKTQLRSIGELASINTQLHGSVSVRQVVIDDVAFNGKLKNFLTTWLGRQTTD